MMAAWICRVPVRLHTVAGLPLMETQGLQRKILERVEKINKIMALKRKNEIKDTLSILRSELSRQTAAGQEVEEQRNYYLDLRNRVLIIKINFSKT